MVMRWQYQRETASSASVIVMEHKKQDLVLQFVTNCLGSASAKYML